MHRFASLALVVLALIGCASAPPPVPLPPDLRVSSAAPQLPAAVRALSGQWTGAWMRPDGRLRHVLVIEELGEADAKVVYAVGSLISSTGRSVDPSWFRTQGRIDADGQLTLNLQGGAQAIYRVQPDGTLSGTYKSPRFSAPIQARLTRAPS